MRSRATDRLGYAHDASHYLLTPQAVVVPDGAAQVAALLDTARRAGAALTFRSGGTSLSGQAGTAGVLVDTRRHFRDVEVLDDGARVRVQPGVTLRQVNLRLARHGRKLGPDPASESACTVGGVVANNSSGMTCGTAGERLRHAGIRRPGAPQRDRRGHRSAGRRRPTCAPSSRRWWRAWNSCGTGSAATPPPSPPCGASSP